MSFFRIKRFESNVSPGRKRAGEIEEVVILLDERNMPRFWPNLFATTEYRNLRKSPNTSEKVLRSIAAGELWAIATGRVLDQIVTSLAFMSPEEAEDLGDFLALSLDDQRAAALKARALADQASNVESLRTKRPGKRFLERTAVPAPPPSVSDHEKAARIHWVAAYLRWHQKKVISRLERANKDAGNFRASSTLAIEALVAKAPSPPTDLGDNEQLEALDAAVLVAIDEAMQPGSAANPFCSPFIQKRNYLIWRLFLDTGGRRNEVRHVRFGHVHYSVRQVEIVISKTIARTVGMSRLTAEAFMSFVRTWAETVPVQKQHAGFICCAADGVQLTARSLNRIFETIRSEIPGVPEHATPHSIRRSWNELFSEEIDKMPSERRPSEKEEAQARARLMGWVSDSKQALRYNRRHIRRKADRIAETMMERRDGAREF